MLAPAAAALLAVASAAAPDPAAPDPGAPPRAGLALPSLLSAETLGDGGSAVLLGAGVPFLTAAYAQGLSPGLDAGALLEVDFLTSELFLGGTLRRSLARGGDFDAALRARAGGWACLGSEWVVDDNPSDAGLQLAPGAVLSAALRRGVLSLSADLPLTITTRRGGGVGFAPRAGLAFETPLYGDWTAGARLGAQWQVGSGGAPRAGDPRGAFELSALLTHRLF
jgi:hypothetical protein